MWNIAVENQALDGSKEQFFSRKKINGPEQFKALHQYLILDNYLMVFNLFDVFKLQQKL